MRLSHSSAASQKQRMKVPGPLSYVYIALPLAGLWETKWLWVKDWIDGWMNEYQQFLSFECCVANSSCKSLTSYPFIIAMLCMAKQYAKKTQTYYFNRYCNCNIGPNFSGNDNLYISTEKMLNDIFAGSVSNKHDSSLQHNMSCRPEHFCSTTVLHLYLFIILWHFIFKKKLQLLRLEYYTWQYCDFDNISINWSALMLWLLIYNFFSFL